MPRRRCAQSRIFEFTSSRRSISVAHTSSSSRRAIVVDESVPPWSYSSPGWRVPHPVDGPFGGSARRSRSGMSADGWSGPWPMARIASGHDPSPNRLVTSRPFAMGSTTSPATSTASIRPCSNALSEVGPSIHGGPHRRGAGAGRRSSPFGVARAIGIGPVVSVRGSVHRRPATRARSRRHRPRS